MRPLLRLSLLLTLLTLATTADAQSRSNSALGSTGTNARLGAQNDSLSGNKEIPKGVRVWTVDKRFGDITKQPMDTLTHMFQNTTFTSGLRGEYNTLGNLGTARINRIFTDRPTDDGDFPFITPYDYFTTRPETFLFTNTLSPYANVTYYTCGNRTNGEDSFHAKFATNAGKRFGAGFSVNYLYGRGYYSEQSTSLFDLSLYASYIGDQYQAHFLFTTNRLKVTENGGVTDDNYVTHPESYDDNYATSEIPTMLESNWNRNSDQHVFFTHRYSLGFHRQVRMTDEEIAAKKFAMESKEDNKNSERNRQKRGPQGVFSDDYTEDDEDQEKFAGRPNDARIMGDDKPATERPDSVGERSVIDVWTADSLAATTTTAESDTSWMKTEFVPVTSFIHTLQYDVHERKYQAYYTPDDYYANNYYDSTAIRGDSIFDKTHHYRLRNTFAISLLEGFNKWMFAGLKIFATSDLQHFELPDESNRLVSYNNHNFSIGGQMSRTQGTAFHYNVKAETWLLGDDKGQVKIDADVDINFPLWGDTVTLAANGFFHNENPNYYLRHFHSQHYWWDDDLDKMTHTHIEGNLSYQKTRTSLRFAVDELTNYTYLAGSYTVDETLGRLNNSVAVRQSGDAITMLTAQLSQDFTLGPLNWETVATWQKSTKQDVIPVPSINVYTNLFLRFRIAKVLLAEMGGDLRWFSEYEAPEYSSGLGQYVVQENETKVKVGNYPTINLYANFNLKGTRFFIMYTHLNCGSGNRDYFLTPHYPLNQKILRFGLSWNFYN